MKIFIVSKVGDSQALARKLINENHETTMYIRDKTARKICKESYVVDNPSSDMMLVDLFVVEDDNSGTFTSKAREEKRPVVGGGMLVDRISKDLSFHAKTIEGCGLKVVGGNTSGIPVNVGGWFGGTEFIRPYFLGFRYDRLGSGDTGKVTRGMGLAGQYKQKGNIFNLLRKLETLLKTSNYQGFVNLKLFINNETAKVARIELGMLFPTVHVLSELHGNMGHFMRKVASNTAQQVAVQPDKVGVGVAYVPNLEEAAICTPVLCNSGGTIQEAISKVYKELHSMKDKDIYYRIDIGSNYIANMKQLKEWEWI